MGWLHIPSEPQRRHCCKRPTIILGLRKRYIGALWSCDECGQLWEWNYTAEPLGLLEAPGLVWNKRNPSPTAEPTSSETVTADEEKPAL